MTNACQRCFPLQSPSQGTDPPPPPGPCKVKGKICHSRQGDGQELLQRVRKKKSTVFIVRLSIKRLTWALLCARRSLLAATRNPSVNKGRGKAVMDFSGRSSTGSPLRPLRRCKPGHRWLQRQTDDISFGIKPARKRPTGSRSNLRAVGLCLDGAADPNAASGVEAHQSSRAPHLDRQCPPHLGKRSS